MSQPIRHKAQRLLSAAKEHREYMVVLVWIAALVVVAVAVMLRQHGIAATSEEQVLECHYSGVAAHTHTPDCYDDQGELVCPLPERELHVHDDSCYEENRELVCGLEEGEDHTHDDSCYEVTSELTCGQEEITEEHVHGSGCFVTVTVDEGESGDSPTPAQKFQQALTKTDKEGKEQVVMLVDVSAPKGALPAGATMVVTPVKMDKVRDVIDQTMAEQQAAEVLEIQAVDISFLDDKGYEIEPVKPVTVSLTSALIEDSEDPHVVHVDNKGEGSEVQTLTRNQLRKRKLQAHDDELYFEAEDFSTYAIVITNMQGKLVAKDGSSYTVTVSVPATASIPQGSTLQVKEITEGTKRYDRYLGQAEDELGTTTSYARFFDITILDASGNEIQPDEPLDVSIKLDNADEITNNVMALHFADDGIEQVDADLKGNSVSFQAEGFSIYAIVSTTIEKNVLASDGRNYKISVTYDESAGVPDDADLEVEEILGDSDDYEKYVTRAEKALGIEEGSSSYLRLFDIKIVDGNGNKVEIAAPVSVKIELADRDVDTDAQVVHFADGAKKPDVVQDVDVDGEVVSFQAEGFSAYAIVTGPQGMILDWHKASDIEDLLELADSGQGFYLGHTDGFFFTDQTTTINSSRKGVTKTKPKTATPNTGGGAVPYYFERVDGAADKVYVYCLSGNEKKYLRNANNNSLLFANESQKTAFTITVDDSGKFMLNNGAWYVNMQGGANGASFACYNNASDVNNKLYVWYRDEISQDPYQFNDKTYGLISWNGGAAGKALMGTSSTAGTLDALQLTVLSKTANNEDKLFVPNDSEITMWSFEWLDEDHYHVSAVIDGSKKYLQVTSDGVSMVSDITEASTIQVVPGSGTHAGEICLKANGVTLTYSGDINTGFGVGGSVGSEWLNLADMSELTSDYFMTYSASKVSVSDPSVDNGSRIIVYTRSWNDEKKRYEFYAINHDGTLVPCYEYGDSIQWVGGLLNTMLWNFVEYYDEGTGEPNYYYELFNQYSEKFIAPGVNNGQILSGDPIGINLNGRRNGQYYSSILAWDDDNYAYAGLKVENGQIVSCPRSEAMDFYFAVVQDIPVDGQLTTVPTLDHTQYGITMKIVNFSKEGRHDGSPTSEEQHSVLGNSSFVQWVGVKDLLGSTIPEGADYPIATKTGRSLGDLYANAQEVNRLFIESTYRASGYFEFDSAQNFATLKGKTRGDFTVYKELGTSDSSNKDTLKHGQFFPYNDIEAGVFASVNGKNLYDTRAEKLPNGDPRKNEQLYLVKKEDYFFGVELEASFTQTPDGLDDWGHDIIFEFTGDDDFWLYVDGELIIDLGGIHSALPGSVNFRTGTVNVNGVTRSLRSIFEAHYRSNHSGASDADVNAYLDEKFDGDIFKDYSTHTMRIFYMERGAGASNLHMRFNLASVKPGTVLLSKELEGVDTTESVLAEFPYQIFYKLEDGSRHQLEQGDKLNPTVTYKGTDALVTYEPTFTVDGIEYKKVFLLKPGELAEIDLPDDAVSYEIVECGVNTSVYSHVKVNDNEIDGAAVEGHDDRADYATGYESMKNRARVIYKNEVNPDALRKLTISKKLFAEDGTTPISHEQDGSVFKFRLYLGTEFADELTEANMYAYHVLTPDRHYCRWDSAHDTFVATNYTDFEDLSDAEKQSVTFTTSMNGTISKIPVDYIVEVRTILAGTQYRVVERGNEIPDGYSLQKYLLQPDAKSSESTDCGTTPAQGTVVVGKDPHVDVCNLKGWGLRVNKKWTDADYMSSREDAYFGIFYTNASGDDMKLVSRTLRVMPYSMKQQSLYWYFPHLPVENVPFERYGMYEAKVTNPVVNDDGYVTSYGSVTPIGQGEEISLSGTQKGESRTSTFDYSVLYDRGETDADSNVRVDEVTNNRPGIVLRKAQWDGTTPLAGATFTLEDGSGNLIGTYTSDAEGMITEAFLSDNVNYKLTETHAPNTYYGLEAPATVRLNNKQVTVSGVESAYYVVTSDSNGMPTLTIKDRPYTFEAIKRDADTEELLAGVHFALHRQVTVDGKTTIDLNPMPGYEDLVTDENGAIPGLTNQLAAGTYELRETQALANYETLDEYVDFTISPTGAVTLGAHPEGTELTRSEGDDGTVYDGTVSFTLAIGNVSQKSVSFQKVDIDDYNNVVLEGAVFDLYADEDGRKAAEPLYEGLKSGEDGMLAYGKKKQTVFKLAVGKYYLVETEAPSGYIIKANPVVVTVTGESVSYNESTSLSRDGQGISYNPATKVYTLKISNSSGYELPSTGGMGTYGIYALGVAFMVLAGACAMARRRAKATL